MAPDLGDTGCRARTYQSPWPQLSRHIACAELSFATDHLLASQDAERIELPEVLRSASAKRRADYTAGRLCAGAALARLGGPDLHVGRRANGAPDWPAGFCGSISHAGNHAIALAAESDRFEALGVDVECLLSVKQAHSLAPLILTPNERSRFASHPAEFVTTAIFSLKESLFKLLHPLTGVMFFHEQAEVLSIGHEGHATLRLLDTLSCQWPAGSTLRAYWQFSQERVSTALVLYRALLQKSR